MRRREFGINGGLALGLQAFGLAVSPRRAGAAAQLAPGAAPVGVRTGFGQGWSDPPLRWMTTRLAHTMPYAARELQLVYANVTHSQKEFEAAGTNPIVLSAAIEYPEGSVHQARFGGRSEMTLAGGDTAVSDPVAIAIPPGASYFTRTIVRTEVSPYLWPYNRVSAPHCGDWVNKGTDPSGISDAPPEQREHQSKAFGPYNILGKTEGRQVSVAIIGDSVVAGEPGDGDRLGDRGFLERAMAGNVAWCNLAESGNSLAGFLKTHDTRLGLIRQNFTHAICALGIGDIRGGNEAAIRARFLEVWRLLSRLGLKVFQTTITTHTTSTDHWTTTAGQAVANPNFLPGGIYQRINDWIRSVPAPLAGCFDPSARLETEPDSGIWIAPNGKPVTNDGPHPNALGAEIAARSIDLNRLKL